MASTIDMVGLAADQLSGPAAAARPDKLRALGKGFRRERRRQTLVSILLVAAGALAIREA